MQTLDAKTHKDLIIMIMALGDAYLERELYAEAAKRYQQLLEFKVANKRLYTNLSKAYIGLKRLDKSALEIYKKAAQHDPANSQIYEVLANSFLREGREDDQALAIYRKALRQESPLFEELAVHLGTIYFKKQEFDKCKEVSERLLNRSGLKSKPLGLFLRSCWNLGNYNDAILQLKKLIDRTEDHYALLKDLCFSYLEKKFAGELTEQELRFSYVDRQFVTDYLTRQTRFENLQDLSFYLELKRFYLEKKYWGHVEPFKLEDKQSVFVHHAAEESSGADYPTAAAGERLGTFDLSHEVLRKLSALETPTGQHPGSHSIITYEDFRKEGAAIFSGPEGEAGEPKIPEDREILLTIWFSNFSHIYSNHGFEQVQRLRNKLFSFLTELIEKYGLCRGWATSNGLLLFTNDIFSAVAIATEILNTLKRHNFTSHERDQIHLAIGIHHGRTGLGENNEKALKDLCVGVKLGLLNDKDLAMEDRPIYEKFFQKSDRILLSSKAYREIKSSHKFKVNSIGQFRLKYLREELSLHEVVWRNPIDDLKFGFVKKLGRFDLLAEIGSKSAVKVFKAKDSVLQRLVILKVIQSEAFNSLPDNSPQKLEFYRIAKLLGQMHHPNIANIYEVAEDQALTYIAREFVEGVAVTELFKSRQAFNADRFIKVIYQICKALQHSHRLGCRHLNLKPNNILLGLNDEIKIMDFLIPKELFFGQDPYGEKSEPFHYMAPEQIRGMKGDALSDIFSLGIILYQMATGVHPFAGLDAGDVANNILNKTPAAPRDCNDQVPRFCEAFMLKCLVKNPDKRFQSFEQMVTLLRKTFENKLFSNFNYQIAQSRDAH